MISAHGSPRVSGQILLLILTAGCSKHTAVDEAGALVTVQVTHPVKGTIAKHILSDAVLSASAQAALSPRISAPVRHFYVQRGSRVKAGQLLATLEDRDLAAAAIDTKGTYSAAQAAFNSTSGAQVPEETERSRLDVAQAKATRDLDASIVEARQTLFDQGAIAGRELDTARSTLVQAQAAYDLAAQHLAALQAVSRKATLDQSKGAMLSAKGKYLGAEAQLSYAEVRSPIAGTVTERPLFEGETAAAGTTLITVMDTTALLAKIHLAQSATQFLRVGDTASVTLPGVSEPVAAHISLISPALDPGSTTLEVWLRLDNHAGEYKVGTPVRTSVEGQSIKNALIVPAVALLTEPGGGKYVMVLGSDSAAHKRPVKVGITDGDRAQILEGLSSQDAVITAGAYGLDDGTKVQLATAGDDAHSDSPGGVN